MNGILDKLQNVLIHFSQKVNENKVLKGISKGFASMLPIVMVGAIFTLLASLNISVYQNFITSTGLKGVLSIPAAFTSDMISVYAVFLIAQAEADVIGLKDDDATASGIIALMVFLILLPLGVTGVDPETNVTVQVTAAIATGYLGSKGLFTAMIVGILIPRIHNLFVKYNIVIKMPESVPPMIAKSFNAMIPALGIALLACLIKTGVAATSYGTVTDLIYGLLKAPLSVLTASPITYALLLLVCNLMWFFGIHGGMVAGRLIWNNLIHTKFFGIHGGMVAGSFRDAMYTEATLENLAAYTAGTQAPNVLTTGAWLTIGNIGGSACAIGLCLCIALFAKSSRFKALNKISLPAGLCGISEPMVFGFPMVLNPILLIPMLIAPTVTLLLGYAAMATGLVPYMIGTSIPTGTPILFSGFIAYGSWKGVALQLVLIAVSTLIYYPFFKMCDNQELKLEKESQN